MEISGLGLPAGVALAGAVGFALGWLLHRRGERERARAAQALAREEIRAAGRARDRAQEQAHQILSRHRRLVREHRGCEETIRSLEARCEEIGARRVDRPIHAPPECLLAEPAGPPDDLTAIRGIGRSLERDLNRLGIFHYWQLAELTESGAAWLASQLDAFQGRIRRDAWIEQSRRMVARRGGDRARRIVIGGDAPGGSRAVGLRASSEGRDH